MDLTLRIVLLIIGILFLAFVLIRIRRGKYMLKYALIWIVLSVVGIIAAIFPDIVYLVAGLLGFSIPSNFVYFSLICFLLISNFVFCGILSRQESMIKDMIQEISLLKGIDNNEHDDDSCSMQDQ